MFLKVKESTVIPGKYIKQLSIGQAIATRRNVAENEMYVAGADLIALSYYNDSGATSRMFENKDAVLSNVPPALFEQLLEEVGRFSGLVGEPDVDPTQPT